MCGLYVCVVCVCRGDVGHRWKKGGPVVLCIAALAHGPSAYFSAHRPLHPLTVQLEHQCRPNGAVLGWGCCCCLCGVGGKGGGDRVLVVCGSQEARLDTSTQHTRTRRRSARTHARTCDVSCTGFISLLQSGQVAAAAAVLDDMLARPPAAASCGVYVHKGRGRGLKITASSAALPGLVSFLLALASLRRFLRTPGTAAAQSSTLYPALRPPHQSSPVA